MMKLISKALLYKAVINWILLTKQIKNIFPEKVAHPSVILSKKSCYKKIKTKYLIVHKKTIYPKYILILLNQQKILHN